MSLSVFWYRRDLRLEDNAGLHKALKDSAQSVQPIFIFDSDILKHLSSNDRRVAFLHQTLQELQSEFRKLGSDLWVFHGKPSEVFRELLAKHSIKSVFCNHDYEPYAIERDLTIRELCESHGASFQTFKDQVIFEKREILTDAKKPYTVYNSF